MDVVVGGKGVVCIDVDVDVGFVFDEGYDCGEVGEGGVDDVIVFVYVF